MTGGWRVGIGCLDGNRFRRATRREWLPVFSRSALSAELIGLSVVRFCYNDRFYIQARFNTIG